VLSLFGGSTFTVRFLVIIFKHQTLHFNNEINSKHSRNQT